MTWFFELLTKNSVAHTVLVYALVIASGLLLGKIQFKGISLGVAGMLFTGIIFSHFGLGVETEPLHLLRDIGLILFVYSIGLQVGPSFFSSLRKEGLSFNLLAVGFVGITVLMTLLVFWISGLPSSVIVGIMSGAVTNTPGLGAAQQSLSDIQHSDPTFQFISPALGYAVTYPLGVLSPIVAMLMIRFFYKINISNEVQTYKNAKTDSSKSPKRRSLIVQNPTIFGKNIASIKSIFNFQVVISRIFKNQEVSIANDDTILEENDRLLAVGKMEDLEKLQLIIGDFTEDINWSTNNELVTRDIYVTNKNAIGKNLEELNLVNRLGFTITRIRRAGMQIIADSSSDLFFGDQLRVVGEEKVIENIAKQVGNSTKRLEIPDIIPIFLGISLGVLLGSIPIDIPFVPKPVKLGLAGGPLIVAILISRYGQIGKMSAYITGSANLLLREIGIAFFLSSVGLSAGEHFVETVANGGLIWIAYGLLIGVVPLLIMSVVAKSVLKKNFLEICGILSGCCTNPPSLAFGNSLTETDYPATVYATVFPLATFLRIVAAQLLVIFLL